MNNHINQIRSSFQEIADKISEEYRQRFLFKMI